MKQAHHHHGLVSPQRRNFIVVSLLVATVRGVVGFSLDGSGTFCLRSPSPSLGARPPSCLHQSVKEKAASLDLEQSSPQVRGRPTPTSDNVLTDPSTFISQMDDTSSEDSGRVVELASALYKIVPVASLLFLLSQTSLPSTVISTYSTLLCEHPLPTKSLTSGILCGISDVIAQSRDDTRKEFNFGRLIRFAGKGCLGGIIWSFWYDNLDRFLDLDNEFNIYRLSGIVLHNANTVNLQWIRDHLAITTTFLSIVIEQFFWCPIVFGTFEIPVSTLLNGGSISTVQKEVDSKLNGLLVSNAKVWTLANIIIYNVPVDWRPAISNCVDILWQSIVSDVAADCGKVEDDVCEVPLGKTDDGKDYAFYAEKSRL